MRIIPARAGFTHRCPARVLDARGSSPLARGLLPSPPASPSYRRDHPRSRGVYGTQSMIFNFAAGSSPLARGLLEGLGPEGACVQDHPRSRGVYTSDRSTGKPRSGSSPLARGLHVVHGQVPPLDRIIPARAGFTTELRRSCGRMADHPRSRGVYGTGTRCPSCALGSSPLARGLRRPHRRQAASLGIIPARAGFTGGEVFDGGASRDHPRSRGVYCQPTDSPSLRAGSSPLARGLLTKRAIMAETMGIIPARAGFTLRPRSKR